MLDVEAKLIDLVERVGEESIYVSLGAEPCYRLVVCAENEIGANVLVPLPAARAGTGGMQNLCDGGERMSNYC